MFRRLMQIVVLAGACTAQAQDAGRIDHFDGEPAETLDEALANFTEYNRRLAAMLESESLDAGDLQQIHRLSYTLENALERIDVEIDALAATLEALHLASEQADFDATERSGRQYLETARKLEH